MVAVLEVLVVAVKEVALAVVFYLSVLVLLVALHAQFLAQQMFLDSLVEHQDV
jgi:hypothetical protein